ncbi:PAS domain-containing protein [Ktedonosporobacter rubrisoli]|nr:PAS domain-containing protein [Ktedonosporobacter rubrisoli]
MAQEDTTYFTTAQAASMLGVHPNTVRRWARHNLLDGQRLGAHGIWHFTQEALQQIRSHKWSSSQTAEILTSPHRKDRALSPRQSSTSLIHGGGEMTILVRSFDWSQTSLGPIEWWPPSLRTGINIMLNSATPMFIWWGREALNFFNDASIPIIGQAKHAQWLGRPAKERWQEIWHIISPLFESVMETGKSATSNDLLIPLAARTLSLKEVYFTFSYGPLYDDSGRIGGAICVCTETTARVLSERRFQIQRHAGSYESYVGSVEESVEAERRRLHGLFMQAPAAVAILNGPKYHIELANPTVLKILNKSKEDVRNKPLFEVLPEIREQGIDKLLAGVMATGIPYVGRELNVPLNRRGDGQLEDTYFTFVYTPLRNTENMIEGVMVFAYEVTEQVIARQKVEESEERFRTLADHMSQFAWMADETGWIFWYNQRWYDYTGTSLAEMEGWGWQKVHHPDHVQRVVEKISHCFQVGESWEDTFPLRGKDGTYRWFLSRAIPIRNEQGRIIRWFGTNTDVTEQKQLEQQKDEFIGIASHELKTPVTSLKAYTQLLERRFRRAGDEQAATLLARMDIQLNKLTSLIGDLLDVTKIESGKLQFHFSLFDYNELIQEIVEEIQRTTSRHTIVQKLESSPTLTADRERIGQVLINLLTNAIKYSPQAETIVIKTLHKGDQLITSVQDFGIGIPLEKQIHIFERFYRVEGDKQVTYPGLGLGLYISAEFIRRHEGSIWLESEEGQGTTFSFSLPLSLSQCC